MIFAHTRIFLSLTILLITGTSQAQSFNVKDTTKSKEAIMSTIQSNKEIIRKLYEEALNKRNLELLKDLISGDYVGIRGEKGVAAFEEPVVALIKAFPDIQWNIREIIVEGDKIVIRWKLQGTQTAQYQYISATGKTVSNDGMAVYELKDGKIIGSQVQTDRLGFLQQLNVLPLDLATLQNNNHRKGEVSLIDKFILPAKAKQEFMQRVNINRAFIKNLDGFIEDAAYERVDEVGNLIFVTVAIWKNEEAINKAKEAVQAEYKKEGFNMPEFLKRLDIMIDRGVYTSTPAL
jgi:predicted ester cyclase/heme-degrading monooxygenase HmoA